MLKSRTVGSMPETIGNYRIIGKLGKGGMGDIYKAIQEPLNRVVALKVLPPQLSRDEEFSRRFEIEAQAISLLQHQNIVSIYEYGEDDGYRFFAMQYVDGTDLSRYIFEKKTIPVTEITDIAKQICRGLRYAHANNIIHRDIKPQNVLIDKNGTVRLSDFGIAKIFTQTNITMTGSAVGTPEYMSPEQAQGKRLDAQTDIYSLGILMYEMLTRKPPFLANNPMAVAYKQVHELPVPPSIKRRDTPKRLELIIMKALKKDKRDRYNSVEELLEHLDSVDPAEKVGRTTLSLQVTRNANHRDEQKAYTDRRITDRRNGARREPFTIHMLMTSEYWAEMARTQWLSWLGMAILGGCFVYHLVMHGG